MKLLLGNCLEQLKTLSENSIDSVVTDPPYGLSFMGKKWDYDVPSVEIWKEVFRVLKPGGHLLSFGGTRTYHRMVVNIEDAGFEIRDQIQWIYGSGFPKSQDISKAIDKQAGLTRPVIGSYKATGTARNSKHIGAKTHAAIGEYEIDTDQIFQTAPASAASAAWSGWGTALKPANEPIVVARKPLEKGLTVAANVLKWGTGGINVDGCRVGTDIVESGRGGRSKTDSVYQDGLAPQAERTYSQGRWPANILFDEAAAEMLDAQSGLSSPKAARSGLRGGKAIHGSPTIGSPEQKGFWPADYGGGASRFFYIAKASKSERNMRLEGMPLVESGIKNDSGRGFSESDPHKKILNQNFHPTVKPIKLMEYLCKLVTPPQGTVLDPFMGSGSTGVAAKNLGFDFVGCEMNEEYFEIAKKRMSQ